MKSKIFKIIIIMTLIFIATIGIVLADSVKINGKTFKSNDGTYHNAFQDKGNKLFAIKWDDVKGKYYTAGTTNDYSKYIEGSRDGYCLNEDAGDGKSMNFYVSAIVDIDGGNVTVYSRSSKGTTEYIGKRAAEVAKVVYYKYNRPNEKDISSENTNAYYGQYWLNHWGWNRLYTQIDTLINDQSVRPTTSVNKALENKVTGPSYNLNKLSIKKDGDLTLEKGKFSVSGKTYTTKIGKYKIVYNDKLSYQIKVVTVDDKEYDGVFKDGYIYISEDITEEIELVKITQSYEGYKARLIILGTGQDQARMIAYSDKVTISKTATTKETPVPNAEVSLQKYITKVNDNPLTKVQTVKTNRLNLKTSSEETNRKVKDNISLYPNINEVSNANKEVYKQDSPVKISAGDKVTYTIQVYNNSEIPVNNVLVKDRLPYYKENEDIISYASIDNIYYTKDGKRQKVTWNEDESGSNTYEYTIEKLEARENVTFEITVKFNIHSVNILTNSAWISSTEPKNGTEYRTVDRDYIKMDQYSVSLEKFITQVTDNDGNNTITYNDRSGKRYNDGKLASDKIVTQGENIDKITRSPYKIGNKVSVEVGDIVTYTIRLKNTGENPVKITEIYDSFRYVDGNGYLEYGLTYVGNGKLKAKYNNTEIEEYGEIVNYNYGSGDINNGEPTIKRYFIEFNTPQLLQNGEYIDVYIQFKADVDKRFTNESKEIYNKAAIRGLENENGVQVKKDSDGEENNYDCDWVITQPYAVSLEKYIAKVNGKDLTSENTNLINRVGQPQYNNGNNNRTKYNNIVNVSNGDKVTYAIKVTNDGNYDLKNILVTDYLPNGVNYNGISYTSNKYCEVFQHIPSPYKDNGDLDAKKDNGQTENTADFTIEYLAKKQSTTFYVEVTVIEPNTSINILKNVAEITSMNNRNDKPVIDTTPDNNKDADYIQLDWVEPEYVEYEVVKKWEGNPTTSSVRVKLFKIENGQEIAVEDIPTIELTQNDNWSYKWKDLPKYADENKTQEIDYIVRELNEAGEIVIGNTKYNEQTITEYSEVGNKMTITNKVEPPKVSFTVEKMWVDNNSSERPNAITVGLFKVNANNKEKVGETTLSGEENWSHTWTDLPEGNYVAREMNGSEPIENGNEYNGYTVNYSERENETIIINSKNIVPEYTTYKVVKEWVGNSTATSVKVKLFKVEGGKEIDLDMPPVELNNDNSWSYVWKDLPKYADENKTRVIDYVARELNETGRKVVKDDTKYNDDTITTYTESGNEMTIANRVPTLVSFTVEKLWDDNNNPDRPKKIDVQLYKGNDEYGKKIQLNKDNYWSYTWIDLPEGDYVAREMNGSKVIGEGQKYNDDYTAYYLEEPNKTTITNKMDVPPPQSDLAISGVIWNDLALDKQQKNYNGLKDPEEKVLSGVTVKLFRVGKGIVATTTTNQNGEYSFTNDSLSNNSDLDTTEKFIKGPQDENGRWTRDYYSYYIIFEYNGLKYTPTGYSSFANDETLDSNAKEDFGKVSESRRAFNNKFSTIKSDGAYNGENSKTCELEYITKNENGYIPQSVIQDSSNYKIQASTDMIVLSNNSNLEAQIKHINLGLRGRDVFDLELTSDVYSTRVTINNIAGAYSYNNNKVTLRREDTTNYNYFEDTANVHLTESEYIGDRENQGIRETDINVKLDHNSAENPLQGENNGLKSYINGYRQLDGQVIKEESGINEIEVTYKITVKNTSSTPGTATKITNYYDDAYTFVRAYAEDNTNLTAQKGAEGNGYESRVIETLETRLEQSKEMVIYVVYILNKPLETLRNIDVLPTFNMSEITEYKTFAEGEDEYTRGLIDKDSAPGSVNKEKVRLHPNLIGNVSTVDYYFGNNDLSVLKYEDDTYATPTLYFVKDGSQRTLSGTVFRDSTQTSGTNIKTGDGVFDEENKDEVGVYGATVSLIEVIQVDENTTKNLERFETTTDKDGKFEFSGYLPGRYIVRYYYGDKFETVLLNQAEEGINRYSFNGEDYQSTNNEFDVDGVVTNKLRYYRDLNNEEKKFWHIYNETEGISTAQDNSNRRVDVSNNVIDPAYSDKIMQLLNNVKGGLSLDNYKKHEYGGDYLDSESLIYKTYMYADTEEMELSLEKPILEDDEAKPATEFNSEYRIENMNFGIAEVPVTTIDLQKNVEEFNIIDATGENKIVGAKRDGVDENGNVKWIVTGDVLVGDTLDVSMEDEKLQGARLEVTYNVTSNMNIELNYDNTEGVQVTITGMVDFINNNLTYNPTLGKNDEYWEVITHAKLQEMFDNDPNTTLGTVDQNGTIHNVVVKAKPGNPALLANGGTATIVLEKILSSTDSTLEDIIKNTVDIYQYSNIVEIVGLDYKNYENGDKPLKDRVRIPDVKGRYIIIPGIQYDYVASDKIITIHPPTGVNMSITYYVMAVIGLAVLAIGIFGIKKYVIKK